MILKLFPSNQNIESYKGEQDKFEMVGCQFNGEFCKEVRSQINMNYADSHNYLRSKEYDRSINELENAYDKTFELYESPCAGCATLFRSTIKDSVENIYEELESMSHGFFKTKRYQSSCENAKIVLDQFKNGEKGLKKAI